MSLRPSSDDNPHRNMMKMAEPISTRSSKIVCLCGTVTEPGNILAADHFPISAGFCGCSICRQSTGALGIIPIHLTGPPSTQALAACKRYVSSERVERYFCATCGSHVFLRYSLVDMWMTLAGAIDRKDDAQDIDTFNITKVGFLKDTLDGGLAARLRSAALKSSGTFADVLCYSEMPIPGTQVPLADAQTLWQDSPRVPKESDGKLLCSCHCAKVQLYLLWPDKTRNDLARVPRMLRANESKYVAKLCVCRSCRLATSTPFMAWTYIMPENILNVSGKAINFEFDAELEDVQGAQVFYSSKDTRRSFCDSCGATLFYEHKDRPELIDVSMGILRSDSGALAEDLVEWDWPWVSWKNAGRDNNFLKSLTAE